MPEIHAAVKNANIDVGAKTIEVNRVEYFIRGVGFIEDLWHFGKPRGVGGPWKNSPVKAGVPSPAYMMTGFDRKAFELLHDAEKAVTFRLDVDFLGTGQWHPYAKYKVPPGRSLRSELPDGYSAHWVRVTADVNCSATAWFTYE